MHTAVRQLCKVVIFRDELIPSALGGEQADREIWRAEDQKIRERPVGTPHRHILHCRFKTQKNNKAVEGGIAIWPDLIYCFVCGTHHCIIGEVDLVQVQVLRSLHPNTTSSAPPHQLPNTQSVTLEGAATDSFSRKTVSAPGDIMEGPISTVPCGKNAPHLLQNWYPL